MKFLGKASRVELNKEKCISVLAKGSLRMLCVSDIILPIIRDVLTKTQAQY